VFCLIATDDEAFTYNHKVNRIAPIQEHFMIMKALGNGVSEQRIATTLNVDVGAIRQKRDLLNGVCPEAVSLLKDRQTSVGAIRELKRALPIGIGLGLGYFSLVVLSFVFCWLSVPKPFRYSRTVALAQEIDLPPDIARHGYRLAKKSVNVEVGNGIVRTKTQYYVEQEQVSWDRHIMWLGSRVDIACGWPMPITAGSVLSLRSPYSDRDRTSGCVALNEDFIVPFQPTLFGWTVVLPVFTTGWISILYLPAMLVRCIRRRRHCCTKCGHRLYNQFLCPECGHSEKSARHRRLSAPATYS
jgi:hypothetical protein